MSLPHPFRELSRWWDHIPLHMAAMRRSWDDAEELRLQLEEVLSSRGPVVISQSDPDDAFGLGQHLAGMLAEQQGRGVIEAPLGGFAWAEEAAWRRTRQQVPPAGIPPGCPDLSDLVSQLAGLKHLQERRRLVLEPADSLREVLYYFHSAYHDEDHPLAWSPARWQPKPTRALITGAGGFVGGHLRRELEAAGWEVHAAHRGDLTRDAIRSRLAEVRPARVFHLAAQSSVAASDAQTMVGNILAQRYLLEGLAGTSARVLVVGSSEEYGLPERLPLDEGCALRPRSLYAVSKVGQDLLGRQFHRQHGLHVVRARPFNHTGPGRPERFMEASFAHQIARIERGEQAPVLKVGNLEARRDFSDVRDVVRAYRLLLEHGAAGEVYQVASGTPRSAREVLDGLLAQARVEVTVEVDPERLRPADIPESYGATERLREATGWSPTIPWEQTLRELLESARTATG